ncbi:MAG: Fic family protein [Bacilli bacterium]
MPIINGMNSDYVDYFSLEDYISRIKLLPRVLEHLEETNKEFDKYINELFKYDEEYIINYWIYLLYIELISNQKIESLKQDESRILDNKIFFDTLSINHKRIHTLHNFITEGELEPTFSYRDSEVNVSKINSDGSEDIFWRGVKAEDVIKFMNDFIKVYKQGGTSLIFSNPFLVSSLIHLLFLRIHPYSDGNGRTARIIHNIKFTESINKLYGSRLKISPLNISESILINKITYVKRIDNIYFDIKHDSNNEINAWFNFILDMVDEQLYKSMNKLQQINPSLIKEIPKSDMRLSRLKHR